MNLFPLQPITNAYDDHAVEALPYAAYANGGVNGKEFFSEGVRLPKPHSAVVACLRSGSYAGHSYDVFLDVWVQTRIGSLWVDVVQFPRLDTSGGSVNNGWFQKVCASVANSRVILNSSDLVGGNVAHILGDEWRVRYKLFGENIATAYTFGVHLMPLG